MNSSDRPESEPGHARPGGRGVFAGLGLAALAIACCLAPVLIAGGALGVLGAWLSSPLVLIPGGLLLLAGVAGAVTRRRRRGLDDC